MEALFVKCIAFTSGNGQVKCPSWQMEMKNDLTP